MNYSDIKSFFYRQIILGSIISATLYFITVWLIFGLMPAMYLTGIITILGLIKLPLLFPVVQKAADGGSVKPIIIHLVIDAAIIIISTIIGLYAYFSAPILYISLYSLVLFVIIAKTFHSNIGMVIYMVRTGTVCEPTLENDPVAFIAIQLSTLNFMLIPLYTGLFWWMIHDIPLSVLTALLVSTSHYVSARQRAVWIVQGNKAAHNLLHYLVCTITVIITILMMRLANPDVITNNLIVWLAIAAVYYLVNINDMNYFNKEESNDE